MVLTDAEATLAAARITAEATRWAGWLGFFGGCLALAGAVLVGLKQTHILQKQDEILRATFHLERSKLKFDLYEKRFGIYLVTREFLKTFLVIFRLRNRNEYKMEPKEFDNYCIKVINEFLLQIDSAYFLFEDKKIYFEMAEIEKILEKIKNDDELYDVESVNLNSVQIEMNEKWIGLNRIFYNYLSIKVIDPL